MRPGSPLDVDSDEVDRSVVEEQPVDRERSGQAPGADEHSGGRGPFDRFGEVIEPCGERVDDRWQIEDEEVGR
jgi:hypothetical protein